MIFFQFCYIWAIVIRNSPKALKEISEISWRKWIFCAPRKVFGHLAYVVFIVCSITHILSSLLSPPNWMERHSCCCVTTEWNQYEPALLGWSSRDWVKLSQIKGISTGSSWINMALRKNWKVKRCVFLNIRLTVLPLPLPLTDTCIVLYSLQSNPRYHI